MCISEIRNLQLSGPSSVLIGQSVFPQDLTIPESSTVKRMMPGTVTGFKWPPSVSEVTLSFALLVVMATAVLAEGSTVGGVPGVLCQSQKP